MSDGELMAILAKECPRTKDSPDYFEWIVSRIERTKETKTLIEELNHCVRQESMRHKAVAKGHDDQLKRIQSLCCHVFANSTGLPSVGYDVCEICGFEEHRPK
jgi:hypothetical protein